MISSDHNITESNSNLGATALNPPIIISGNSALDSEPAVTGGPGNSYADAYLIENYEIDTVVEAGIYIENTDKYINISNCVVTSTDNHPGIELLGCSNITIFNCTIENRANGLMISNSNNISIQSCICTNNFVGIFLTGSNNLTIINNYCSDSTLYGIQIDSGNDNFVSNNYCYNNEVGIRLGASSSFNEICFNSVWGNNIDAIQDTGINNNVHDNILTPPDTFDWVLFAAIITIGAIAGTGGTLLVVKRKKKSSGKVCVDTPKPRDQVPTGSKLVEGVPCSPTSGADRSGKSNSVDSSGKVCVDTPKPRDQVPTGSKLTDDRTSFGTVPTSDKERPICIDSGKPTGTDSSGKVCVDTPKPRDQVPKGSKLVGSTPLGSTAPPTTSDNKICVDSGDKKPEPSKAKLDSTFKAGHIVKPVTIPPKGDKGEDPAQKRTESKKDEKEKPSKTESEPTFIAGPTVKKIMVPPKGDTGEESAQKTGKSKRVTEPSKDKKEKS